MLNLLVNNYRSKLDISGFWNFKIDKYSVGENEKWYEKFISNLTIAVPGSWNEQFDADGLMNYVGDAWYQKEFFVTSEFSKKNILVRIGSADYSCKVWINGSLVGNSLGGFLPAEFDITEFVNINDTNSIVIKVNNELNSETIPQGIKAEDYVAENRIREETFPPARFDFFPFGGLQRPVYIYSKPKEYINKIKITSKILSENSAKVSIQTNCNLSNANRLKYFLIGNNNDVSKEITFGDENTTIDLLVENCRLWDQDDPFLYKLKILLQKDNVIIDEYTQEFGIREVKVEGNKLLLNNKSIFLKGFGKHEDFPILGKGLSLPLIVKDFSLLKWINANSFRTSHYPYAEEWLDYADREGILVIDEVPAVSLDFRKTTEQTLTNHKVFLQRLIDRDFNHPCVIMWATGNEPNLVGEESYYNGSGDKYWGEIYNYTKSLDSSRPITIPNCERAGIDDPVFNHSDVISLNRYYGWYENPGNLEIGLNRMEEEMDIIAEKYKKPIIVSEFGADTVSGLHSITDQMFTEEYQSKLLELYCKLIESKDYTVGEHVWNFADFKTPQHFRRVVNNLKGVFTRTRDPKQAAFTLKRIWAETK